MQHLLNSYLAGPFAWSGGKPGQVGNEAAIVAQEQCRSQARLLVFGVGLPQAETNPVHFYFVFGSPSGTGLLA